MGSRCCYFSSLDTCINKNSCESLQKVLSAVFHLTSSAMYINSTLPVIASSRRNNKISVKPVIKFQQSNLLPVHVIFRTRLVHKSSCVGSKQCSQTLLVQLYQSELLADKFCAVAEPQISCKSVKCCLILNDTKNTMKFTTSHNKYMSLQHI